MGGSGNVLSPPADGVCNTFDTRTKIRRESSSQETVPGSQETVPGFRSLMDDNDTADFTIRCETKEFRVHKNVFCAR